MTGWTQLLLFPREQLFILGVAFRIVANESLTVLFEFYIERRICAYHKHSLHYPSTTLQLYTSKIKVLNRYRSSHQ